MTSHRVAFYTYKVIAPYNIYLDNDSLVKMIGMDSIVVNYSGGERGASIVK
jgi:hypothetical protein